MAAWDIWYTMWHIQAAMLRSVFSMTLCTAATIRSVQWLQQIFKINISLLQLVPDLGHLGGTPVIHLSTCVPNTPSSISGLLPTAHTLHTTSQLTPSQLTVHPTTTLSIPSYLQGASCLEVAIEKLLLGAGLTVPPLR